MTAAFWLLMLSTVAALILAAALDVKLAAARRDAASWRTLCEAYPAERNASRVVRAVER